MEIFAFGVALLILVILFRTSHGPHNHQRYLSMMPTQIIVPSEDDSQLFDVELLARDPTGQLLPPGVWMVRKPGERLAVRTEVEEMPQRWRDEIDEAYRVGKMIRLDGPHNSGTGDE